MTCACGKELDFDELGLNRKFSAGPPLCKRCLARKLGVTEARLDEKIEEFRRAGCLYFTKQSSDT